MVTLIEMPILRIHHRSLSIANEILAQILVQRIAVALELREFIRPTLILVFGARSFLAKALRMAEVLRYFLSEATHLTVGRCCRGAVKALPRLASRFGDRKSVV